MAFRDNKFYVGAKSVLKNMVISLVSAISQTQLPFFVYKVGYPFKVTRVQDYCSVYAATLSYRIIVASGYALLGAPGIAIDATAEKFKIGNDFYTISAATPGVLVKKAAAAALTFTAAHTVNVAAAAGTGHWGAILVQLANDGATKSTKVVSADQDYATEALAIAALPAADAGKLAIGYITIQVKTGGRAWTANTDDMTAASDVTAANFYDVDIAGDVMEGTAAFVQLKNQDQTLSGSDADLKGDGSAFIVGIYTSDGAGALTNGRVAVEWRPTGLSGEVS